MKKCILFLIVSSAILFSCNSNNAKSDQENYELLKENLLKKEQETPQNFLIISGNNKMNLLGQTVVKGTITNKASVATFKDAEIKLSFYSKTKALLETDKETVFEQLAPGESKHFKTKYFAPKGTDSVALEVLSAKVVSTAETQ